MEFNKGIKTIEDVKNFNLFDNRNYNHIMKDKTICEEACPCGCENNCKCNDICSCECHSHELCKCDN